MSHMAVYRTENNGGEPNTWKIEKVADIDWQEFSKQMLELHRIVDAGIMSEQQHQQVKEAITSILMDGLMPAFLELEQIRASVNRTMPLMERWQLFEDLARKLWKSYKELMQNAANAMDFNITAVKRCPVIF